MSYRYYFDYMKPNQRKAYDAIYDGLSNMDSDIFVPGVSKMDDVMEIWRLVLADCPEIFYVLPSFSARSSGGKITAQPSYSMKASEVARKWGTIERHRQSYLEGIDSKTSDYDCALRAYEYIIRLCDYGFGENDQNMSSVFCESKSSCAGYASAFKYLMDAANIPCLYAFGDVHGRLKDGAHAWNAVCIDGMWRWVDVTWGDPTVEGRPGTDVHYDYLLLTDKELGRTHRADPDIASVMPKCSGSSIDWFARNHMLFSSYEESRIISCAVGCALWPEMMRREHGSCPMKFERAADLGVSFTERMLERIAYCREQGLAVVIWLLTNVVQQTKKWHPLAFIAISAVVGIVLQF